MLQPRAFRPFPVCTPNAEVIVVRIFQDGAVEGTVWDLTQVCFIAQ